MFHAQLMVASLLSCVSILVTSSGALRAGTVLSNLAQPLDLEGSIGTNNPTGSANRMRAQSFKTGTNPQGYRLESATLGMSNATGAGLGDFVLQLYGAHGFGWPTTLVGDFIVTSNPVSSGLYTFQFGDPNVALTPATHYSLVARSPTSTGPSVSQYFWQSTVGVGSVITPGWSFAGPFASTEGSGSWSPLRAGLHRFSLDATAIPEPGAIALLSCVAVVVAVRRQRRH